MKLKTCSKSKVRLIGKCLSATKNIKFIFNVFSKWLFKIISKEVDAQIDAQLPDWVKLYADPSNGEEAVKRWRNKRELNNFKFDKRPCNAFDCDR